MSNGTLKLRGQYLLDKSKRSIYKVAQDGSISYPTAHKYLTDPHSVKHMSADVLYGILLGLGYSQDEAKNLTLGEVFEFVEDGTAE